jgi:hypothetical protein
MQADYTPDFTRASRRVSKAETLRYLLTVVVSVCATVDSRNLKEHNDSSVSVPYGAYHFHGVVSRTGSLGSSYQAVSPWRNHTEIKPAAMVDAGAGYEFVGVCSKKG